MWSVECDCVGYMLLLTGERSVCGLTAIVMTDQHHRFDCSGVVTGWEMSITKTESIDMHVSNQMSR